MLKRINYKISVGLYWAVVVTCSLFVGVVLLGVLTRYIFKTPILGSVELSRLFFLWSCFLAASLCYYRRAHIYISFVADRFPAKWLRLTQQFGYAVQLIFFLLMVYKSAQVVKVLWETDLPMLEASQSLLYLPVPLSLLFMSLFCLEFLADSLAPNDTAHVAGTPH